MPDLKPGDPFAYAWGLQDGQYNLCWAIFDRIDAKGGLHFAWVKPVWTNLNWAVEKYDTGVSDYVIVESEDWDAIGADFVAWRLLNA